MSVWFEGGSDIACNLDDVVRAMTDHGSLFAGITRQMPGISVVELIREDAASAVIRTNEGEMNRNNLTKSVTADRVIIEFDERYEAGKIATPRSHYRHEFVGQDNRVTQRLIISDVRASGLLGFLYRTFGRSSIGNAYLRASKTYLEAQTI